MGFFCSLLTALVLVIELFSNKEVVPNLQTKLEHIEWVKFDEKALLEVVPFVVFLYMYQGMLPQLYRELDRRSLNRMDKVMYRSSVGSVLIYLLAATVGYLTFSD